jgi:hypothetical protein
MKKHLFASLVSVFALLAFAVAPALATEVTPASSKFEAKLVTGTEAQFKLENGTGAAVLCKVSTTSGTTPSSELPKSGPPFFNNNPSSEENTKKLAGGSVLANLILPKFETCTSPATTTTVTTSEVNGKWSIDWNVLNSAAAPWTAAAIGVPKAGATIKLVAAGKTCELTVDPETAQGVTGYWENGKNEVVEPKGKEESKLYINEQVFYAATAATKKACEEILGVAAVTEDSPAVFRATYTIENAKTEGIIEKYS